MTTAEALAKVKLRLDIETSDTSFDAFINDAVLSAVDRLFPLVQRPVAAQTKAISTTYGTTDIDLATLTTPLTGVKKVEGVTSTSSPNLDDFYVHGTILTLRDVPENIATVRLYGLAAYATIDTIPNNLTQAIVWYAMSEFYDMLSAEKGRYNEYMNSGARNVDNMRDQSDYYEQKANVYLVDRVTIHGTN